VTDENKKENIREGLERAAQAMHAATLLFDNSLFNDAVSKLYYFLLYYVRVLLLTKGLEPKNHEGALKLLSQHFIKDGPFEPKVSHAFSKLMKHREEADYNPSYFFTKEDFIALKKEAEQMADVIRAYLKDKGYL
jgi:hypothetical protein